MSELARDPTDASAGPSQVVCVSLFPIVAQLRRRPGVVVGEAFYAGALLGWLHHLCWRLGPVLPDPIQARVLEVLTDPHTGKALVIANQSRNMRSKTRRSVNSAVRADYRSLAAFFIDLRPK